MNVDFPQSQLRLLEELAFQTGRGIDELIQEAVSNMLAHEEWFRSEVKKGIDQIQRGQFLDEEEMTLRVDRILQS